MLSSFRFPRWSLAVLLMTGAASLLAACGSDSSSPGGTSCSMDTQCPATAFCNRPATGGEGVCEEGCRLSPDSCTAPLVCQVKDGKHECVMPAEGEGEGVAEGEGEGEGTEGEGEGTEGEGEGMAEGEGEGQPEPCNGDDTKCEAGQYCATDGTCLAGCRQGGCPQGQHCDLNTRQCVNDLPQGCNGDDAKCDAGQYCAADGSCQAGCRQGGCPQGQHCDLGTRQCVNDVEPGCAGDDTRCEASKYCDEDDTCQEGCRVDPDNCPQGQHCDADTHECEVNVDPGCNGNDANCPQGQYCGADNSCQVGCRQGECPQGQHCDLNTRQCVNDLPQGCNGNDGNCDPDEYCAPNNECQTGCRQGSCPQGQHCDLNTRQCVNDVDPGCQGNDAACPQGQYCDGNTCKNGCRVNPDSCPQGQHCDANHACVPDGPVGCEGNDANCPQGQYCDINDVCQVGCREGGCPQGQRCNLDTRECVPDGPVGCQGSDANCAPGQYCAADNSCQAGCRLNPDSCPQGQHCDANRTCVPDQVGGCADQFQGNSTRETAAQIEPGTHYDLGLCPNTADYYKFTVAAESLIYASIVYAEGAGTATLNLLNPDGTLALPGSSINQNGQAILPDRQRTDTPGTYYLLVSPPPGQGDLRYKLAVFVVPAGACQPDRFEPNDEAAEYEPPAQMTDLSAIGLPLIEPGLRICPPIRQDGEVIKPVDTDWYSVPVRAGVPVSVWIRFLKNVDGDMDALMICGEDWLQGEAALDPSEKFINDYVPAANGTCQLRISVFPQDQMYGAIYTLSIW